MAASEVGLSALTAEAEWACPACTLLNADYLSRCAACDGRRPGAAAEAGANTTGVVVVLPPDADTRTPAAKRPREDDSWNCGACTLLNSGSALRCRACGSARWILPPGVEPSALDADMDSLANPSSRSRRRVSSQQDPGGDQPQSSPREVSEWATLPPAPDGHVSHVSAKDTDTDIFSVDATNGTDEVPSDVTSFEPGSPSVRPVWGGLGGPLFSATEVSSEIGLAGQAADDIHFEDALARLQLMGFDHTKCHLALEAAGGNEELAREFLIREA